MCRLKLIVILLNLLLIAGCNEGGSGGLASLFSSSGSSSSSSSRSSSSAPRNPANPEPSSFVLLSMGLGGLVAMALRKKRK